MLQGDACSGGTGGTATVLSIPKPRGELPLLNTPNPTASEALCSRCLPRPPASAGEGTKGKHRWMGLCRKVNDLVIKEQCMGVIELGSSNSVHQNIFLNFVTTWL